MAQIIVRNLEEDIRDKLKALAQKSGQSMEEIVRDILRKAVMKKRNFRPQLGTLFVETFAECGLDSDIQELRGQSLEPLSFDP